MGVVGPYRLPRLQASALGDLFQLETVQFGTVWECPGSLLLSQRLECTEYTVQQALRVKWRVFGVFVCFDLYFVNYRSWQAEILQECAEGCIQGDLQKKIRQT